MLLFISLLFLYYLLRHVVQLLLLLKLDLILLNDVLLVFNVFLRMVLLVLGPVFQHGLLDQRLEHVGLILLLQLLWTHAFRIVVHRIYHRRLTQFIDLMLKFLHILDVRQLIWRNAINDLFGDGSLNRLMYILMPGKYMIPPVLLIRISHRAQLALVRLFTSMSSLMYFQVIRILKSLHTVYRLLLTIVLPPPSFFFLLFRIANNFMIIQIKIFNQQFSYGIDKHTTVEKLTICHIFLVSFLLFRRQLLEKFGGGT